VNAGQETLLWAAVVFAMIAAVSVVELFLIGAPPRHCQYLVPIKSHPGVYGCSEYPRPRSKP
jgi:hypothetical protein